MLTLILAALSILGGILLLFFKPIKVREVKTTSVLISLIVLFGSFFLLFPGPRTEISFNSEVYFSIDSFSGLLSIVLVFLTLFALFTSAISQQSGLKSSQENDNKLNLESENRTGRSYILLLILQGLILILLSSGNLIQTSFLLLISSVVLFFIISDRKPRLYQAALKTLIYQLIGIIFLFGSAILIETESKSSAFFLFFLGLIFLLPLIPAHTYLSDLFAEIRLSAGIAVLIFQLSTFFIMIKFSTSVFSDSASASSAGIILPLVSLFIIVLSAKAQEDIYRLFSYLICFFYALAALYFFASYPINRNVEESDFQGVKFLVICLPLILASFWVIINLICSQINNPNNEKFYLISRFKGVLRDKLLLNIYFVLNLLFVIAFPLTPIFYGIISASKQILSQDFTITFLGIPLRANVILMLVGLTFLLHIYWIVDLYRKLLTNTENDEIQEVIAENSVISRNHILILTGMLILILILSIFPVYFFQNL